MALFVFWELIVRRHQLGCSELEDAQGASTCQVRVSEEPCRLRNISFKRKVEIALAYISWPGAIHFETLFERWLVKFHLQISIDKYLYL